LDCGALNHVDVAPKTVGPHERKSQENSSRPDVAQVLHRCALQLRPIDTREVVRT
jgi:hypothetical protein